MTEIKNAAELKEKIKDIFVEYFELERDALQDDKQLFTDLGLDSLDIVDLIAAMQKEFKFDLRMRPEMRTIRTFGDVCNVMEAICKEQCEKKK